MTGIVSKVFGWVRGKLLSYILIVAVLVLGGWAQREINNVSTVEGLLDRAKSEISKIDHDVMKLREERNKNLDQRNNDNDPTNKYLLNLKKQQEAKEEEIRNFKSAYPILARTPLTQQWWDLKLLDVELALCEKATKAANEARAKSIESLSAAIQGIEKQITELTNQRKVKEKEVLEHEEQLAQVKIWQEIIPKLWLAAAILALAIASRIAIKLVLYFIIAPLASRRQPVQILPDADGTVCPVPLNRSGIDPGKISSVSHPVVLEKTQELLVRPEYLQSVSLGARKKDRLFLHSGFPYTSLLSGMFLLTKVSSTGKDEVVVSSTNDPLSEICVIELPDESAFVCQPRALVGVVQDPNRPIQITRHWRPRNLQSWLTLQLRFLVFHGPGKLIIKGCRGVRMEDAGNGRMINQDSTIGFSANIQYANVRTETFVPYLMGKEALFNDVFSGDSGSYLYEEMPDLKHKSGITGRGLEGIGDAVLKFFGI